MIATLSFAALAGCGGKSIAKNDETTISDTVKQIQKQTEKNTEATAKSTAQNDETTVGDTVKQTQKQTEKAADVITDAAKESTSAEGVTTEAGSTEAEVSGDAIVATEPANEVAEANEPSYKPAAEPDTPAYEPTDTAPADTPVNIPDNTPAEEPADNTPAPAEPSAHEHDWVPTYCYIEWIASQTTSEDQYVPGGTVTVTRFEQAGQLIDHYECDCGATKDGENKSDIAQILSTKNVPEGGIVYYTDPEYFFTNLRQTTPSYPGCGPVLPMKGQW